MKKVLAVLLVAVMVLACLTGCAKKKEYPAEDIRVIVPFGAGGNTDSTIRALCTAMGEVDPSFNMLVENKPGAAGHIGMELIKDSDPDGYTVGAISCELFLQQNLGINDNITFDDFDIICIPGGDPYGLVISANNPNFSTAEEFVEYAKANPGKVKLGHCGIGGMTHVGIVKLMNDFGLDFDLYTYGGSADCVAAINSGEIDGTFTQPNPAVSGIKGGTLLMPLILASEKLEAFPDTPTYGEVFGEDKGINMRGVVILGAPKGLPEDVFNKFTDVAKKAADSKTCQDQLISLGISPYVLTGEELKTFMTDSLAFYADMCKMITLE